MPLVIGGRYGLSSKEFTPAMVAGVFDELAASARGAASRSASSTTSADLLAVGRALDIEPPGTVRAVFFGLGSDGTVGANKNTIKILGDDRPAAQGYFVYDSKKSGAMTISHLRFGRQPIRCAVPGDGPSFVGCHQFGLLERSTCSRCAADGATLLVNAPDPPEELWDALPRPCRSRCWRGASAPRDRRGAGRARAGCAAG